MMSQVLKRMSHDYEQEEKRLKLQLSELKKKPEMMERRYAHEVIEKEVVVYHV